VRDSFITDWAVVLACYTSAKHSKIADFHPLSPQRAKTCEPILIELGKVDYARNLPTWQLWWG